MKVKLDRFDMEQDWVGAGMYKRDDGDWTRYDDLAPLLRLYAACQRLRHLPEDCTADQNQAATVEYLAALAAVPAEEE